MRNIITKTIATAMILGPVAAHAEDISVSAGRCGAYHLARSYNSTGTISNMHVEKAELAAAHATNKGIMRVAANAWVELAQRDIKTAVEQAQWSCIYHLKIGM